MFFTLLTFALLASAISANKILLYSMTPTLLVGIRMFSAGLILLLYTFTNPQIRISWNNIKKNLSSLIIITLTTTFIPSILKAYSLKNISSSKMAFFGALDPFITAVFAYFMLNEKLNYKKIVGIFIGLLGSIILNYDNTKLNHFLLSRPELVIIISITITRFGWMTAQKLLKKNIYQPVQLNAITMLLSGIISLNIAFMSNQTNIIPILNNNLHIFKYSFFKYLLNNLSSYSILIFFILYTIIIGNVIAYNLYANLLKKHSALYVSLTSFSVPLLVHLYGFLFLDENLSIKFLLSCIVTFTGLIIFSRAEEKK